MENKVNVNDEINKKFNVIDTNEFLNFLKIYLLK